MAKQYRDLGIYSDLSKAAARSKKLYPVAKPGVATQKLVKEFLSFEPGPLVPKGVKVEREWTKDGIDGQLLSWSVGYGPRTEAFYLRPAGVKGVLPGVVALHDHGGFKAIGKEKIATGPEDQTPVQKAWVTQSYGGVAYADRLARHGYAVLVPDTFLWGSRKFPLSSMPAFERHCAKVLMKASEGPLFPWLKEDKGDMTEHSAASTFHEHTVQKYCAVLGTTLSGVISFEDRVSAAYLAGRKDVQKGGVGCVGLSGGGLRSTLLRATSDHIKAAVVVGLMSSYEGLLDHNVIDHTWMLYPSPALAGKMDWPDMVSCRAPSPLMVQYDNEDQLFTLAGQKAAHRRIAANYKSVGKPGAYVGKFYPGLHKFDLEMQDHAFAWLDGILKK